MGLTGGEEFNRIFSRRDTVRMYDRQTLQSTRGKTYDNSSRQMLQRTGAIW